MPRFLIESYVAQKPAAVLGEAAGLADLGHLRIVEAIETGAPARLEAPA